MKTHYIYQNIRNRNAKAKELIAEGYNVRKYSMRNQLMHPMYIEDYGRELSPEERGFGNTIYQTHFKAIYIVEVK